MFTIKKVTNQSKYKNITKICVIEKKGKRTLYNVTVYWKRPFFVKDYVGDCNYIKWKISFYICKLSRYKA